MPKLNSTPKDFLDHEKISPTLLYLFQYRFSLSPAKIQRCVRGRRRKRLILLDKLRPSYPAIAKPQYCSSGRLRLFALDREQFSEFWKHKDTNRAQCLVVERQVVQQLCRGRHRNEFYSATAKRDLSGDWRNWEQKHTRKGNVGKIGLQVSETRGWADVQGRCPRACCGRQIFTAKIWGRHLLPCLGRRRPRLFFLETGDYQFVNPIHKKNLTKRLMNYIYRSYGNSESIMRIEISIRSYQKRLFLDSWSGRNSWKWRTNNLTQRTYLAYTSIIASS